MIIKLIKEKGDEHNTTILNLISGALKFHHVNILNINYVEGTLKINTGKHVFPHPNDINYKDVKTKPKLRKEVKWFANLMEEVLKENDYKSGWKKIANSELVLRLLQEVGELIEALINEDDFIEYESADVANIAMMIADNNK